MRTLACMLSLVLLVASHAAFGQEDTVRKTGLLGFKHRPLDAGAVAVTAPGNCDKPGTTYMLMNDITSSTTPIFLGRDVTLDLNGYTITFADGPYEHVPNSGFEEDFKHWDTTKAPDAKVEEVGGNWPFVEKKVCRLPQGQEIVSEYITLPVADRSYYAMCGVLSNNCKVSVSVDDEQGNPVEYEFHVGEKVYKTCPMAAAPMKLLRALIWGQTSRQTPQVMQREKS